MRTFYRALLRHRWLTLLGLTAVTIAFGRLLVEPSRLLVDFSLDALLVPDTTARAELDRLHADFGDDLGVVGVVVALPEHGPTTVFDPPVLGGLARLRAWLAARPEIDADGLVTLLDLPDLRGAELRPFALGPPDAAGTPDAEALGARPDRDTTIRSLLAHRSYRGLLLAEDARATLVVAPFAVSASDQRKALLDDLARELARLDFGAPASTHLVGVPLVQVTYASIALRDVVLLVPLTILIIAILLGVAFRRPYAIIGPLAGVGLATIWTLGLIQALGLPFDMVNSVAGVVILVVGVAEGAHIVARHREEVARLGADPARATEAILATMDAMTPACFVTSATTAVGFGSLTTAQLPAIASFGAVLAAGVMMAWAIQMLLMPIVLSFTHPPSLPRAASAEPLGNGLFGRFLDRVAAYVLASPMKVALVGLTTATVAGVGALHLRADARAAGELQPDHPVARSLQVMEHRLSGVLVHSVAITGRAGGTCQSDADCAPRGPRSRPVCRRVDVAFRATSELRGALAHLTDIRHEPLFDALEQALAEGDADTIDGVCAESVLTPDVMAFLGELEAWIVADRQAALDAGETPLVSRVTSLLDPLFDLGRGASPLELSEGALAERVGILESGAPALVGRQLAPDHTRAQLVIRANDVGLAAWRDFEPRLSAEIARLSARHDLGARVQIAVTGGSTLAEKAVSGIGTDLVDSVAYDFLLILVFIIGLVRNTRLGLLAMVPNLWPLLVTLGAMGFMDIPIRASTIIVFSVALGIAVDDTTHFVHRYREEVRTHGEGELAIRRTLHATGRPIVLTTIILVAGFLLNALSDFKAIVEFGVLSAVTLGLALVAELFLTPALLMLFKGRLGKL